MILAGAIAVLIGVIWLIYLVWFSPFYLGETGLSLMVVIILIAGGLLLFCLGIEANMVQQVASDVQRCLQLKGTPVTITGSLGEQAFCFNPSDGKLIDLAAQ